MGNIVFILAPAIIAGVFAWIALCQENTGGGPIRRGLSWKIAASGFVFSAACLVSINTPTIVNPPYEAPFFCLGALTMASGGTFLIHMFLAPTTFIEAANHDEWYKQKLADHEAGKTSKTHRRGANLGGITPEDLYSFRAEKNSTHPDPASWYDKIYSTNDWLENLGSEDHTPFFRKNYGDVVRDYVHEYRAGNITQDQARNYIKDVMPGDVHARSKQEIENALKQ